jgi:hypothetical protein
MGNNQIRGAQVMDLLGDDVPLQGNDERFNHRGKGHDPHLELRVC